MKEILRKAILQIIIIKQYYNLNFTLNEKKEDPKKQERKIEKYKKIIDNFHNSEEFRAEIKDIEQTLETYDIYNNFIPYYKFEIENSEFKYAQISIEEAELDKFKNIIESIFGLSILNILKFDTSLEKEDNNKYLNLKNYDNKPLVYALASKQFEKEFIQEVSQKTLQTIIKSQLNNSYDIKYFKNIIADNFTLRDANNMRLISKSTYVEHPSNQYRSEKYREYNLTNKLGR